MRYPHRRRLLPLLLLIAIVLVSPALEGQSSLNGHTVRLDGNNKLLAWPSVQGNAYDDVLRLATNFLLNGMPTASNGLKLYYTYSYALPGPPVTPEGWPHNPAGLYSMLTDSGLAYYAYSGNTAMAELVRDVLTYQLDHGMTPATWDWPKVAFASSDGGDLTYQGAHYGDSTGSGDGFGVIQPDKVAEIGVAFLQYYQFSGVTRFRDAAIQAADVLASHSRTGDATHSPWPFRVFGQTNVIREQYTAAVLSPIRLFDALIRLNLGNVAAYQPVRQSAWDWLMQYPIRNNVWSNYFEDLPIQSDTSNTNQLVAGETARYLMRHPEFDPNWEAHARGIISWIESTFASPQFGANTIAEQQAFFYPMGSHTSRYASLNARLYELTGDAAALEKAYRSFNWASYMTGTNGVVIDGPLVNHVWWTDGYGDYIKHFLGGLGSVPQWAPEGQSHLLRSTSVVRSVTYAATEINYAVAETSSQEVLRLNFIPQSVTVDGVGLTQGADLSVPGWTYDSVTKVVRLRHDTGTQIRVSGAVDNNLPPDVRLDTPLAGSYQTSTLSLAATASDPDGTIANVDFLANGNMIARVTTSPFQFIWSPVAPGTYAIAAAAVDDKGARVTTPAVSVIVTSVPLPAGPSALTATAANTSITLNWQAPSSGTVDHYGVYRSTTSGFTPAAGNLIGQPVGTTLSDPSLGAGTYYYKVIAFDAAGNPSQTSNEATASIVGSLSVDKVLFSDGTGTRTLTGVSTTASNALLLAFVASDGAATGQTIAVSGAGLTWTQVARAATQSGASVIWRATAPSVLSNATITATQSQTGYHQSLTLVTFNGSGGTGAAATAGAANGAPSLSLTTTRADSLVYGVGNDWSNAVARTLGTGQTMVHQWVDTSAGDTFWVQRRTATVTSSGTVVQIHDTAPTNDRWNLAAVEVLTAAASPAVAVPNVIGQTQVAARSAITSAGLTVGTVTTQSSASVPSGSVISQTPAGNTQANAGSAVAMVVSSGPAQVTVPNVVGQTQTAAQSAITAAGLTIGAVTTQASASVPSGSVIGQTPPGNTQAASGTAVSLVVSAGSAQVTVPNVVGQTQTSAQSAITAASLTVGAVTTQASASVPSGSVIGQTPAGSTQAPSGSAVALVVSSGSGAQGGPVVDRIVFSDGAGTRTTAAFTTTVANELLVAFVAADGPKSSTQSATITGAGLTWTLVRRVGTQHGTSEIWRATASGMLTNATVTSTLASGSYRQSLTVVTFSGASGVGASATASATTGAPSVSLTTTRANALVYAVGNDWDRATGRTLATGQTLIHQVIDTTVGDTFWVQARTGTVSASGTVVRLNATAPSNNRWNMAAVEIVQ